LLGFEPLLILHAIDELLGSGYLGLAPLLALEGRRDRVVDAVTIVGITL
jgi:hypothetical protein